MIGSNMGGYLYIMRVHIAMVGTPITYPATPHPQYII